MHIDSCKMEIFNVIADPNIQSVIQSNHWRENNPAIEFTSFSPLITEVKNKQEHKVKTKGKKNFEQGNL